MQQWARSDFEKYRNIEDEVSIFFSFLTHIQNGLKGILWSIDPFSFFLFPFSLQ